MDILQCKICKKPFQSFGGTTCSDCLAKIDRDYITVRDYIYENPNSNMDKICEETEVEKSVILALLKDGRLTLDNADDAEGLLLCYICKKPISSGRMCDDCKGKVANTMNRTAIGSLPKQPERKEPKSSKYNAKMHTDRGNR